MEEQKETIKEQPNFNPYNTSISSVTNSGKKINFWFYSTISLSIISIALIILFFSSNTSNFITGKSISSKEAGLKIVSLLNDYPEFLSPYLTKGDINVTLKSVDEVSGVYKIETNISYQGNTIPLTVYTTKDGELFSGQMHNIDEIIDMIQSSKKQSSPKEIPKNDKPIVDIYVFSYCPYGLQFQKAMIPVYKLLKNKAELNTVFIGDMHGEYEKIESLRQLCIQKEYGKDKLWDYVEKFVMNTTIGDCNGDEKCVVPLIEILFKELGIDKTKIESCMKNDAEALYNADVNKAKSKGVSGSPTFIVNGVETSVERSPESIKNTICSAFNNPPGECNQTLSSQPASPWFGSSIKTSSSSGSC